MCEQVVCVCDNVVYERECVTKLCVCDKVVCVTEFVCVCVLFYFCVWVFVFFVSFVFSTLLFWSKVRAHCNTLVVLAPSRESFEMPQHARGTQAGMASHQKNIKSWLQHFPRQ